MIRDRGAGTREGLGLERVGRDAVIVRVFLASGLNQKHRSRLSCRAFFDEGPRTRHVANLIGESLPSQLCKLPQR